MKAFPIQYLWDGDNKIYNGMDLRDYFAAKAMQAYLITRPTSREAMSEFAITSYAMADAMMEARK